MAKLDSPVVEPIMPDGLVFVVTRNSDLTEGRGWSVDEGFYDDLDEAVAAARGIDVQGTDGTVYKIVQLLPEKRIKYWGQEYISEARMSYTGFTKESGRFNSDALAAKVRSTSGFKTYLEYKEKYAIYEEGYNA